MRWLKPKRATSSRASVSFENLEPRTLMSAPTAVVQSTTVREGDWLVVVRYTDPDAARINLSTSGANDIAVTRTGGESDHVPAIVTNRFGPFSVALFQAPIVQSNGSVLAVYRV